MQLNMFNDYESIAFNFIDEQAAFEGISVTEFIRSECKGYGAFINFDVLLPYHSIEFFPNYTCSLDGNIVKLRG